MLSSTLFTAQVKVAEMPRSTHHNCPTQTELMKDRAEAARQELISRQVYILKKIKTSLDTYCQTKTLDAFSTTRIFCFKIPEVAGAVFEDKAFIEQGDILSFTDAHRQDIVAGNYVYMPYYMHKRTKLSPDMPVPVGALILGSRSPGIAKTIYQSWWHYPVKYTGENIQGI